MTIDRIVFAVAGSLVVASVALATTPTDAGCGWLVSSAP